MARDAQTPDDTVPDATWLVDNQRVLSPVSVTVHDVRYQRTGRGQEEVLVLETTRCGGCGEPFEPGPTYTRSWRHCMCTPGRRGHVLHCCLRKGCGAITPEPECWAQHGPTADYGDDRGGVSTHRPSS